MIRDATEQFWGSRPWTVPVTGEAGLIMWKIYMDGVASAAALNSDGAGKSDSA